MSLNDLLGQYVLLTGVAAFVPALINFGKFIGLVKDGTSDQWSAGLNLVGFVLFGGAKIFGLDVSHYDAILGSVAPIILAILGLFLQFGVSGVIHRQSLAGLPVIGKSYSLAGTKAATK